MKKHSQSKQPKPVKWMVVVVEESTLDRRRRNRDDPPECVELIVTASSDLEALEIVPSQNATCLAATIHKRKAGSLRFTRTRVTNDSHRGGSNLPFIFSRGKKTSLIQPVRPHAQATLPQPILTPASHSEIRTSARNSENQRQFPNFRSSDNEPLCFSP
jgi:hypothetical protein